MKSGSRSGTGPGNISGILGNFGFYKYNIEFWQNLSPLTHSKLRIIIKQGKLAKISIFQEVCMKGSLMSAVKGVVWGAALGVAAGVVGSKMMDQNKRTMKRKANKALRSMESMMDTASYMFK